MRDIRKMGNSVSEMIQLEEDFLSKNVDKKLPILDLKVWVRKVEVENGRTCKLFYHYYRKPIANWLLMPAMSAMPIAVVHTALTQYVLRILRNTKLELEWEVKAAMLSEFMEQIRDSGHGQLFRQEILTSILRGWDKMLVVHEAGRRPINRPRNWKEQERMEGKWRKKTTWFKTGGYSTAIFCPYTLNSELAKRWRELEASAEEQ